MMVHPEQGFARATSAYDDRGNLIERAFYNQDEKLLMQPFHYARIRLDYKEKILLIYDEAGDEIERYYFDWSELGGVVQVMITGVLPLSQAEKIGLQPADFILSYEGINISSAKLFIELVQKPGKQMRKLIIFRKGEILSLKVTPGKLGILINNLSIRKMEH